MFDDEKIASQNLDEMQEAYNKEISKKGFIFISLDRSLENSFLNDVLSLLSQSNSCLMALGGFLGTSSLYSLNEKHILVLSKFYKRKINFQSKTLSRNKTKTLLELLSIEFMLTNKLIALASQSSFSKEILDMLKERSKFLSKLFKSNSLIS